MLTLKILAAIVGYAAAVYGLALIFITNRKAK